LFVVPLVNWTRNFKKFRKIVLTKSQKLNLMKLEAPPTRRDAELSEMECAICLDRTLSLSSLNESKEFATRYPIQTPYVTSCGHRYCYYCISEKILQSADEDSYWECLRCSRPVYNVLREQEEYSDNDDNERVLDM
jgi:hypothetical protein